MVQAIKLTFLQICDNSKIIENMLKTKKYQKLAKSKKYDFINDKKIILTKFSI